jgi:hypothetical protein
VLTTIISYIGRPYSDGTYDHYNHWYRSSTRILLTGPPPDYTHADQLVVGTERTAAYHRETSVLAFLYKYEFIAIKINIHNIFSYFEFCSFRYTNIGRSLGLHRMLCGYET